MRVVSVDGWAKARVVASDSVWGRSRNFFSGWGKGETLIVLVSHEGVVIGTVSGVAHRSNLMIWENDLFEWRIPLEPVRALEGEIGRTVNAAIRQILFERYHHNYGYVLLNQVRLDSGSEEALEGLLKNVRA